MSVAFKHETYSVSPSTAQIMLGRVDERRGSVTVNIGLPLNRDRRPYLSGEEPKEEDKIRANVRLSSAIDPMGERCILFSLSGVESQELRLPIGMAGLGRPTETAYTTDGTNNDVYESFEGAVRAADGALFVRAATLEGGQDELDLMANPVPRDFAQMVLAVASSKLPPSRMS